MTMTNHKATFCKESDSLSHARHVGLSPCAIPARQTGALGGAAYLRACSAGLTTLAAIHGPLPDKPAELT